jgi:hypothetical protein
MTNRTSSPFLFNFRATQTLQLSLKGYRCRSQLGAWDSIMPMPKKTAKSKVTTLAALAGSQAGA